MQLHQKRGLVGGVWTEATPFNAFIDLENDDINVRCVVKATTMLEFVVWDPSSKKKSVLSMASMPISSNFHGIQSTFRGNWAILAIVGQFVDASDGLLKGLIFDAHCAHSYVRKLLLGQLQGIDMNEVKHIPFFKDLRYKSLPESRFPKLPVAICLHRDEAFWCLPGVCSSALNGWIFFWEASL